MTLPLGHGQTERCRRGRCVTAVLPSADIVGCRASGGFGPRPDSRTANIGGKTFRHVGLGRRGNPGDHCCRPVPIQPRLR